jgi:outer membrane protein OmpA-like peptidoglycan-associated protein
MSIISREPVDSRRETGAGVLVVVVALLAPLSARPVSTTLLYQTPTAYVLPAGALAVFADVTNPLVNTPHNINYLEADASVRFSPYRHLDFAVTAYTFKDYVLDLKYQLVGGEPDRFGLAVGVYDIGFTSYISPVGHDTADAWPDWKYNKYLPRYDRLPERFSAFAVASFPVTRFVRLHAGVGRGRFVGYDINSKYLNIDYLFDVYHKWAFGLIGGVEVSVTPQVALVAEASGRDLNTGVRVNYRAFTGTVAWTKMEGLLFSAGDERFGRLEVGLRYQFDRLSGRSEAVQPLAYVVPPAKPLPPRLEPEPEPAPVPVPVSPVPSVPEVRLQPIYFDLDRADIRPQDAEVLKRNAEAILARVKAGLRADVIIEGYYALASGTYAAGLALRRAQAAQAYLVGFGVDTALLTARTFGETNPPSQTMGLFYLDRRVEFRWKY